MATIKGNISPLTPGAHCIVALNDASGDPDFQQVNANASGNFTFTGMPTNTQYIIQPSAAGFTFSPVSQTVNFGTTNITGINFVATAVPINPSFTPVFSYSFQGADLNPIALDPNWVNVDAATPPNLHDNIQVLNAVGTTTTNFESDGIASYSGFSGAVPDNQFISLQIVRLTANGNVFMYTRGSDAQLDSCYLCFFIGPLNDITGISGWGIYMFDTDGGNVPYQWVNFVPATWQVGDIITYAVENQTGYFFHNNTLLWQGDLTPSYAVTAPLTSGTVGMQFDSITGPPGIVDDVGMINFVMGTFSSQGGAGGGGNGSFLNPSMCHVLRGVRR